MYNPVTEAKTDLRHIYRRLRKELDEEARVRLSGYVCKHLENWAIFQQSKCILSYMPIKGEVDLTSLVDHDPEKRWVLPRIIPEEDHRMVFHEYCAGNLVVHPFGMAEPAPDQSTVPTEEIQLALVPGLAFDFHGWRLGYGGGYFDRFLQDFSGVSVGIAFHAFLLGILPHDSFDVPVQWIAPEKGFFKASGAVK